ncbi:MAG: tetratricopeptide repeat protein, partial [Gammaproteobacteria bacterium]|nr:tetratricopeptide repeat protein [Gammaproteobacteria bacterium]
MFVRWLLVVSLVVLAGCQTAAPQAIDSDRSANNAEAADFNVQAGLGYLRQQQYLRALSKFEKALQQQPDSIEASMGKAAALQSLERSPEAEQVYQKLVEDFPKRFEPPSAYAGLMCEQQRFKEAEAIMLSALKKGAFAQYENAYVRLARCAVRGQQPELAERYLQRAEKIANETNADDSVLNDITLQRAWLAYGQKHYAIAQERLERFESASPL